MYEFWYDYLKPKYGDKVKLCYMDTDSLLYLLKQKIFTNILLMMLINGATQVIMTKRMKDHYPSEKIKK